MENLSRDPLTNAIQSIKGGIDITIEHEFFGSAVILMYSAMDAMACLGMPAGQNDITRTNFVDWVERYISFPCPEKITGLEFYAARCSTLHTYGVVSKLSREGRVRLIGYCDHAVAEVTYRPANSNELVMVSIKGLRDALFLGIDRFLVDLFSDLTRSAPAESRVRWIFNTFPFSTDDSPAPTTPP